MQSETRRLGIRLGTHLVTELFTISILLVADQGIIVNYFKAWQDLRDLYGGEGWREVDELDNVK
jgi:hypothetical protein